MINSLPQLVILLFSIVFHEVAHGKMALWKGDTTARDAGRLTLNPISHIDPFGTILLPLFLILTRSPVLFGWAKPVPINPRRFQDSKRDIALVGASGPGSNFLLAVFASVFFRILALLFGFDSILTRLMVYGIAINLVLCFFNLIPIPPLDGSRIAMAFLPSDLVEQYERIERYGFIIIFLLLFLGLFQWIIMPLVIRFLVLLAGHEALLVLMKG